MKAPDSVEDLIPRAEIFRSKLIEDFQLLESMTKGSAEVPKYYSSEVSDSPAAMFKMLRETPHALVKFHVYTTKAEVTYDDRRLNRVKTKNTIPFGPWARMIINNQHFHNFMLLLILSNSIVLGVQAEVTHNNDASVKGLKLFLDIFDYLSMMIFVVEILLKWVDGFWEFWKNGWNNFDFFVTVMSVLPELIKLSGKMATDELAVVAENLRVFRILRSLKMVSRFAQLRIIVLTILKAFKSMVFILTLLGVFMYIFAVAGTVIFASYSKSTRTDLLYKNSFSTLGQSLATLFQLFTLDHWFDVLSDLTKVSNGLVSKIYIILWICIGAFIFRNIFAGIMVMNFQNIRQDFANQCNEREQEMEEDAKEMLLEMELAMQFARQSLKNRETSLRKKSVTQHHGSEEILMKDSLSQASNVSQSESPAEWGLSKETLASCRFATVNESVLQPVVNKKSAMVEDMNQSEGFPESATWNATVRLNLHNLANSTKETLWPRDTLFRYFQLMEALQDNLAERQQLQLLAVQAMSNMHDSACHDQNGS
ncbi:cation channel sperm-associated protein 2-like [Hydractinia symbiolongicarpus]|uniref:cation channel sperm-associated protein 2-like n=1 Tax=Hydractinia symbiolongicarpus TaxID=13093 RepID=UPI00254DAC41|nr:cation channel sperm-associated protein 2-like [Hydractinia symbiolongicarpus]